MNLIQKLREAVYPRTDTPVLAFLGDSVTHGAFECIQGESAGCAFDFEAVYHNRLRKKLEAAGLAGFIETKFGVGYLVG